MAQGTPVSVQIDFVLLDSGFAVASETIASYSSCTYLTGLGFISTILRRTLTENWGLLREAP